MLLAEDNPVNQKVAVKMLEKLGCATDVVENGVDAVRVFGEFDYDLVLMDVQMPDMDGFQATVHIRKKCQRGSDVTPLLTLEFRGSTFHICAQHLPVLIHDPGQLVGRLSGAESLSPAEHRD